MMFYSALLLAVLVVGSPYWLVRMMTSGRYRAGLAGRLGRIPEELRAAVKGREVIWVHAVSVGEVIAAARLVEELREALPGWVIAVSTTTETGQRLAKEKLAGGAVFYLPLDFAWVVRRYMRVLRPKMLVLMESELWPRLILECQRRGVPVAVVNARISDRSFPRYMRLRRLWRPLLGAVSLFLAQSEETSGRLRAIGVAAERVRVTGNLKYDSRSGAATPMTARMGELIGPAKLILAGSTLAGEEEAILWAWPAVLSEAPGGVLMIAPRHKERFGVVSELLANGKYPYFRCSEIFGLKDSERDMTLSGKGAVLLLDTIGDLASMYSKATVAFVGGSLVPRGGHNPLEAAQFAVPVVMGPSYENFREMVEMMRAKDAIRLTTTSELADALVEMLGDKGRALGERGREVFESQAGATRRTVAALLELLQRQVR